MDIVRRETLHGRVQMLLPSVCSEELERELVCEAQAGSSAAFDHLMSLHEKRVFRAAMRIAGN